MSDTPKQKPTNQSRSQGSTRSKGAEKRKKATRQPEEAPKKVKKKGRGWFRFFFITFLMLSLAGVVAALGIYRHYAKGLPTLDNLAHYRPSLVTRVFARDYQLLGEFFTQRRQFIPMSDIPPTLTNAFLAIEDAKYYQHPGIDLVGIFRAAYSNFQAGRVVQGASTITQQVAKTFLLSSVKSYERKIKEIILSLRIEQQFSKDEILELYVNQIYLGAGAYGVGAAARIYFNRDVSNLTLGQMALLAGLPKAPSRYSPWRFEKKARKRQKLVLKRMVEVGFVTPLEAVEAMRASLALARPPKPLERVAPHYLEHVRRSIMEDWGEGQLYRGGLEVYTALDPTLQRVAQNAVRRGLVAHDRRHGYRGVLEHWDNSQQPARRHAWLKKNKNRDKTVSGYRLALVTEVQKKQARLLLLDNQEVDLPLKGVKWARKPQEKKKRLKRYRGPKVKSIHDVLLVGDVILVDPPNDKDTFYSLAQEPAAEAALVSLDPHTGQVLAMVGGYDYGKSQFNRATQGYRQPGSAFKPLIYAAAMENKLSPVTRIDDSPIPIAYHDAKTGKRKMWRAQNYEKKFYGPTTLRMGLVHSRNLVTIRIMKKLGISPVISFLRKIDFNIPNSRRDLSLALGSVGFTPLKMASGYALFANGGKGVDPVYINRVQDRFGRTVHRHRGGDCLLCHREIQPKYGSKQEGANKEDEATPLFGRPVFDPGTAYQITNLLKGVITHGTGRKARKLKRILAGKTGTTNDLRDAWFIGFSPSLVTAVWVGMDDFSPLGYRETGSRAALPIWIDYMGKALKGIPVTDFPVPEGIMLEEIDAETGEPVSEKTRLRVMEAFKPGQKPINPKVISPGESPMFEEGLY